MSQLYVLCVGAQSDAARCIWLKCGSKVQMFLLYDGSKLDVSGSFASVSATWNWIPAPSWVVVGNNSTLLPVRQDGFVELPTHLVAGSGTTEALPMAIEPSDCWWRRLLCLLHAVVTSFWHDCAGFLRLYRRHGSIFCLY